VDDAEASDDGDEVFEEGGGEIVAEGFGQAAAEIGTGEGADYGSNGAKKEAGDEGLMGEAEGGSGEGSTDDAGDELGRDLSAGCIGQFVIDDFAERENGEDIRGCGVTEPCEMGASEVDPAESGSPADYGWCGYGSEAGNDSYQEGQYKNGHKVPLENFVCTKCGMYCNELMLWMAKRMHPHAINIRNMR
jgi:hypothetical protein